MNALNKKFLTAAGIIVLLSLLSSEGFAQVMILKPNCPDQGSSYDNTSFGCRKAKPKPGSGKLYSSIHKGEDYRCSKGTPMGALMDGDMTCHPNTSANGNYCVQKQDCMTLLYLHLNDYVAAQPGTVKQGTLIGHTGTTADGRDNGVAPHLHLHIKIWDTPISPQYYYWKYGGRNICNDPAAIKDLMQNAEIEARNCPGNPDYVQAWPWGLGGGGGAAMPDNMIIDAETVDETDTCNVSGIEG